jgi:hypothetical protein
MFTAAANQPNTSIMPMVVAWNAKDIFAGKDFAHNWDQIMTGTKWGKIGYDFYGNRK